MDLRLYLSLFIERINEKSSRQDLGPWQCGLSQSIARICGGDVAHDPEPSYVGEDEHVSMPPTPIDPPQYPRSNPATTDKQPVRPRGSSSSSATTVSDPPCTTQECRESMVLGPSFHKPLIRPSMHYPVEPSLTDSFSDTDSFIHISSISAPTMQGLPEPSFPGVHVWTEHQSCWTTTLNAGGNGPLGLVGEMPERPPNDSDERGSSSSHSTLILPNPGPRIPPQDVEEISESENGDDKARLPEIRNAPTSTSI
ncbi:hypothetical protein BDV06DRAFT_205900 [Aspergillus oleicola]